MIFGKQKHLKKLITEMANDLPTFSNPEELMRWMKSNIRYSRYTKLMSHDDVAIERHGSCHDQVMFEIEELKKMGEKPRSLFIMEYNKSGQSGMTHSLVWIDNHDSGILWIENAWNGMQGIHKFQNVKELKDHISQLHKTGKFGNIKQYPELEITSMKEHTPGESLQEFVDKCVN